MRNIKSSQSIRLPSVAKSSGGDDLDRVIGIAPAPLLPGETEADYVNVATRIVAVAQAKDDIEEFLTRDVIDLTWEILHLGDSSASPFEGWNSESLGRRRDQ